MYNAEKYIGECLESILNQTFQDYEVIVVDDCSTDNSRQIVENYKEKFGECLKMTCMAKNSGKPSLPRNKGLSISRGKYIFFVDNDDLVMRTALEELYTLAKNYDADVVYCEKYYTADDNRENLKLEVNQKKIFVDKPTVETESLLERMKKVYVNFFNVMPWSYLIKRDLLTENEIYFPDIIRDDSIWSWNVIFCAKKILRVPNAVYVWRSVESSITRNKKTPPQEINFWLNPVVLGVKTLYETLNRIDFFRENPQYHYAMLSHFVEESFIILFESSLKLPPFAFCESVKKEFGKNLGEQDILISLLCTMINTQQKISAIKQQEFNKFAIQAQNRIKELEGQLNK